MLWFPGISFPAPEAQGAPSPAAHTLTPNKSTPAQVSPRTNHGQTPGRTKAPPEGDSTGSELLFLKSMSFKVLLKPREHPGELEGLWFGLEGSISKNPFGLILAQGAPPGFETPGLAHTLQLHCLNIPLLTQIWGSLAQINSFPLPPLVCRLGTIPAPAFPHPKARLRDPPGCGEALPAHLEPVGMEQLPPLTCHPEVAKKKREFGCWLMPSCCHSVLAF